MRHWISPSNKIALENDPCDCRWHLAEASTIEKVRFAEYAWNDRDAFAGERRAADAAHDIRGFALKLAEEGNWDVVGNNPPPIVDASHDELSARSMR